MNNKEKHIYSAAEIRQYLDGKMPAGEMHALEAAALDDPLLAEAIEGYAGMEQKDWSAELATLSSQIGTAAAAPVVSIQKNYRWKAVAATLIVVAGISTFYLLNRQNKQMTTAAVVEKEPISAPAADSIAVLPKDSNTLIASLYKKQLPQADNKQSYIPASPVAPVTAYDDRPKDTDHSSSKDFNSSKAEEIAAAPTVEQNKNETKESLDAIASINVDSRYYSGNATGRYQAPITGKVVDRQNQPISFATVRIDKNKKAVATDAAGNFSIPASDSLMTVTVSSAGYSSEKATLNSNSSNLIVLPDQSAALQEVQVTAANKYRSKQPLSSVSIDTSALNEDIRPEIGWVAYEDYLYKNLRIPGEGAHGEVEVMVALKPNGEVDSVEVAKPLTPAADAEAVRVVKEGPKFTSRKKTARNKVKVKVKFQP